MNRIEQLSSDPSPSVSAEAVLAAVIDASDDAVFSQGTDGTIWTWDRTAERLFGFASSEVVGESMLTLFPEHLRERASTVLAEVAMGGRITRFESEVLRGDGMPILISLSISPVYDSSDVPGACVTLVRDITEQRLAQAALAEMEARVRDSEALAHVGSWLWDVRTGAVQWSDELHRIHGIEPLEFDGTFESHVATIHSDDRQRVLDQLDASVRLARPFEDVYRVVRPDGEVRRVHARAAPTTGSAGAVLGLRGIAQDVTGGTPALWSGVGDERSDPVDEITVVDAPGGLDRSEGRFDPEKSLASMEPKKGDDVG